MVRTHFICVGGHPPPIRLFTVSSSGGIATARISDAISMLRDFNCKVDIRQDVLLFTSPLPSTHNPPWTSHDSESLLNRRIMRTAQIWMPRTRLFDVFSTQYMIMVSLAPSPKGARRFPMSPNSVLVCVYAALTPHKQCVWSPESPPWLIRSNFSGFDI